MLYTAPDPLPPPPPLPTLIQTAYYKQARIGWNQLLCDLLAQTWGTKIADQLPVNHILEKEMKALRCSDGAENFLAWFSIWS